MQSKRRWSKSIDKGAVDWLLHLIARRIPLVPSQGRFLERQLRMGKRKHRGRPVRMRPAVWLYTSKQMAELLRLDHTSELWTPFGVTIDGQGYSFDCFGRMFIVRVRREPRPGRRPPFA